LTFKFTRGGIKLNLEKLDDYEGKYRKAIIHQPVDSLADKEEPIILENIIDVMDQELQRLTETTAEVSWPNKHWSVVPKEPVPALGAGDEDTAESYLRRIFSVCSEANHRQCVDPAALVVQHPHYFWSVPLPLYQRGVAQREYDQRVVDAIERVCGMPDVWTTGRRGDVMDAVWESLGRDTLESNQILYKTQRFIATGNANQSSQDASIMFVVMGRKEWADRVAIVKSLIQELAAGGEKLKQQWLHESESTSY
jgi:glutamyl-tRNA synthetase